MTSMLLESVGLCAQYSRQGDWAFDFAFNLVREKNLQLNVFYFLEDPYSRGNQPSAKLSKAEREKLIIQKEKELRFYYDELLDEHLKAGFRVCEDKEWTELRRCLIKREFQLVVVPYLDENCTFGDQPIEEFAVKFAAPMVLVGPNNPDEIRMNQPARMIAEQLMLPHENWKLLSSDEYVLQYQNK